MLSHLLPYILLLILVQTSLANDRLDTLGFGFTDYDGTFDNNRLRSRVLDLGVLKNENGFLIREKVDTLFFDNLNREVHIEEGFDEFSTSLKTSISIGGTFSGFKAKVASHYNFESTSRNDYYFSRKALVVDRAHLRIDTHTPDLLQALVIPHVASYLDVAEPYQIFATYGTHVTTRVIAGGMLELWSSSSKYKFSSKSDFSASVSASYLKLVKGSASLTIEEQKKAQKAQSREGLLVIGGDLQVSSKGESNWILSTKTNPETVKFLPGGAIPIWELIKDQTQAKKVKEYYELVYGANSLILKRFESTPIDKANRAPHPQASVYVPRGWKVISGGADVRFYGYGQLLTKSYPILSRGNPIGWKVASKDHLRSDPGRIQAFAVAIWDPYNIYDVHVSSSKSTVAAHPSARAKIPRGYTLVGGGTDVKYIEPGNMMVQNYPISLNEWFSSSKDHAKSAPSSLVSYAIGLKHRGGGQLVVRTINANFGPTGHPQGILHSTIGYSFVGAGATITKGGYGSMLVKIVPSADGKSIQAYGKDHLEVDRQRLTIYGIEVFGATFVQKTTTVAGLDPNGLKSDQTEKSSNQINGRRTYSSSNQSNGKRTYSRRRRSTNRGRIYTSRRNREALKSHTPV